MAKTVVPEVVQLAAPCVDHLFVAVQGPINDGVSSRNLAFMALAVQRRCRVLAVLVDLDSGWKSISHDSQNDRVRCHAERSNRHVVRSDTRVADRGAAVEDQPLGRTLSGSVSQSSPLTYRILDGGAKDSNFDSLSASPGRGERRPPAGRGPTAGTCRSIEAGPATMDRPSTPRDLNLRPLGYE